MNGKDYEANTFAISLRKRLFKEHFCLSDEEINDPLSNSLFEKISRIADVKK